MYRTACVALLLILAGATITSSRRVSTLDLLRLLTDKSWTPDHRALWAKYPGLDEGLETRGNANDEEFKRYADEIRQGSSKRSVVTALNGGRRRRQPAPPLGKVVMPYVGVGMLNDVGYFLNSLRDNLEVIASLPPTERVPQPPSVVQAPAADGISDGGPGMRRLYALRPLRPAGNIRTRSYNRRSFIEPDGGYPGANHHDPGLLWTGLGR